MPTSCSSVQLLSRVRLFATTCTAARQASLSITNSWSLLKLMPIESVMPSSHLILCRPLLLPPSVFPSITISLLFPPNLDVRLYPETHAVGAFRVWFGPDKERVGRDFELKEARNRTQECISIGSSSEEDYARQRHEIDASSSK